MGYRLRWPKKNLTHCPGWVDHYKVCRDVRKAIEISELWEEVTRGQGNAHSCNHDKEGYGDRRGIGLIQREDQSRRPHTHFAMKYLVKDDQHLRVKPTGARCLRKGTLNRVRRR